jgi:glycosyltransferase involved in cell wall biosynthesis
MLLGSRAVITEDMPSVSVAMATFNGARYIRQQLDSLAAQTHLPSELVVTDDGSTDDTLKILEDFASRSLFRVLIHRNEARLGYRANFLHATTLCKSDLIAFSDQDDIWDRRKIEKCIPLFDNPDVLLAYHNALIITAEGRTVRSLDDWVVPNLINPPMSLGPWPFVKGFTQIFRRSVPLLPELWEMSVDWNAQKRMAHDQWFFFLSSALGSIAYVNEPLVHYRQHDANIVGAREREHFRGIARSSFLNPSNRYAHLANCAYQCADILDTAKKKWIGSWHDRASFAVTTYRQLAQFYTDRKTLYTAPETSRRLKAFISILYSGGYGNDRYKLGRKSLAKDALLGVLMGQKLKSPKPLEKDQPRPS